MLSRIRRQIGRGITSYNQRVNISTSSSRRDIYKPATPDPPVETYEDQYSEAGGEYVLESTMKFYMKMIGAVATTACCFYIGTKYIWYDTNENGRQRFIFPDATKTVLLGSLSASSKLYSQYLEEDKLMSPNLKTHRALTELLQHLVNGTKSLGASKIANTNWRIHIVNTDDTQIRFFPGIFRLIFIY